MPIILGTDVDGQGNDLNNIENIVNQGASFPTNPTTGDLFILNTTVGTDTPGLYRRTSTAWELLGGSSNGGGNTANGTAGVVPFYDSSVDGLGNTSTNYIASGMVSLDPAFSALTITPVNGLYTIQNTSYTVTGGGTVASRVPLGATTNIDGDTYILTSANSSSFTLARISTSLSATEITAGVAASAVTPGAADVVAFTFQNTLNSENVVVADRLVSDELIVRNDGVVQGNLEANSFITRSGITFPDGSIQERATTGSLLNGTGAPAASLGNDGDFYIDTTANQIFGPKTNGAWGTGTNIAGEAGVRGATIFSGAGTNNVPTSTITNVADGDYFFNTTNQTLYGPYANSAFPTVGALLRGRIGDEGPSGPFIVRLYRAVATLDPAPIAPTATYDGTVPYTNTNFTNLNGWTSVFIADTASMDEYTSFAEYYPSTRTLSAWSPVHAVGSIGPAGPPGPPGPSPVLGATITPFTTGDGGNTVQLTQTTGGTTTNVGSTITINDGADAMGGGSADSIDVHNSTGTDVTTEFFCGTNAEITAHITTRTAASPELITLSTDDTTTTAGSLSNLTFTSLAGTGVRNVGVDPDGTLTTSNVPGGGGGFTIDGTDFTAISNPNELNFSGSSVELTSDGGGGVGIAINHIPISDNSGNTVVDTNTFVNLDQLRFANSTLVLETDGGTTRRLLVTPTGGGSGLNATQVNSAIDTRVNSTFINNLTGVDSDTVGGFTVGQSVPATGALVSTVTGTIQPGQYVSNISATGGVITQTGTSLPTTISSTQTQAITDNTASRHPAVTLTTTGTGNAGTISFDPTTQVITQALTTVTGGGGSGTPSPIPTWVGSNAAQITNFQPTATTTSLATTNTVISQDIQLGNLGTLANNDLTLPAGTYKLRVDVIVTPNPGNDGNRAYFAAGLRIDGSNESGGEEGYARNFGAGLQNSTAAHYEITRTFTADTTVRPIYYSRRQGGTNTYNILAGGLSLQVLKIDESAVISGGGGTDINILESNGTDTNTDLVSIQPGTGVTFGNTSGALIINASSGVSTITERAATSFDVTTAPVPVVLNAVTATIDFVSANRTMLAIGQTITTPASLAGARVLSVTPDSLGFHRVVLENVTVASPIVTLPASTSVTFSVSGATVVSGDLEASGLSVSGETVLGNEIVVQDSALRNNPVYIDSNDRLVPFELVVLLSSTGQTVNPSQIAHVGLTEQYVNISGTPQLGITTASAFTNATTWSRLGDGVSTGGGTNTDVAYTSYTDFNFFGRLSGSAVTSGGYNVTNGICTMHLSLQTPSSSASTQALIGNLPVDPASGLFAADWALPSAGGSWSMWVDGTATNPVIVFQRAGAVPTTQLQNQVLHITASYPISTS